jgi:3-hydroxyisobutyrate dehydrogenase-like beta-hydroxyacid dehydrogenase
MKDKRIGWIGTGIMGGPMAKHLVNAGYKLNVYNRTKEKAAWVLPGVTLLQMWRPILM